MRRPLTISLPDEARALYEVWRIVQREYVDIDNVDARVLSDGAIFGILEATEDTSLSIAEARGPGIRPGAGGELFLGAGRRGAGGGIRGPRVRIQPTFRYRVGTGRTEHRRHPRHVGSSGRSVYGLPLPGRPVVGPGGPGGFVPRDRGIRGHQ